MTTILLACQNCFPLLFVDPVPDIQDLLLSFPEPDSLTALIAAANQADQLIIEQRRNRVCRFDRMTPAPLPADPRLRSNGGPGQPVPMEIDVVTASAGNRPKLTQEEKDRRRTHGLCLYCGLEGHIARNCPARAASSEYLSEKKSAVQPYIASVRISALPNQFEQPIILDMVLEIDQRHIRARSGRFWSFGHIYEEFFCISTSNSTFKT